MFLECIPTNGVINALKMHFFENARVGLGYDGTALMTASIGKELWFMFETNARLLFTYIVVHTFLILVVAVSCYTTVMKTKISEHFPVDHQRNLLGKFKT